MSNKFAFKKKDEKELKKDMESVKDLQEIALENAKLCLHSKPFKEVLDEYKEAERATINVLLRFTKEEHDIMKFGYAAKDLLHNIAHIKAMIDVVHIKAGEEHNGT